LGRLLPQIVFSVSAFSQLQNHGNFPHFDIAIPTGNFGNILAALIARRMGGSFCFVFFFVSLAAKYLTCVFKFFSAKQRNN
jgi:hypothetical protein